MREQEPYFTPHDAWDVRMNYVDFWRGLILFELRSMLRPAKPSSPGCDVDSARSDSSVSAVDPMSASAS